MKRRDHRPLKPAVFHILLALARDERHGLGIADEIEEITGGAVRLGPGTLYRSLKQMAADGLIRESRVRNADVDPRRRYYTLTEPAATRSKRTRPGTIACHASRASAACFRPEPPWTPS